MAQASSDFTRMVSLCFLWKVFFVIVPFDLKTGSLMYLLIGISNHLCKNTKVNNVVCRVDFDEAWVRSFYGEYESSSPDRGPYPDIDSVPDSMSKAMIRRVGRALFIEPFATFPVSYLDDELIVFEFELLGTRVCARREG